MNETNSGTILTVCREPGCGGVETAEEAMQCLISHKTGVERVAFELHRSFCQGCLVGNTCEFDERWKNYWMEKAHRVCSIVMMELIRDDNPSHAEHVDEEEAV